MNTRSKKGFTLIELMIVVAIIGILAAIAIPQFANLIAKSQEGSTKGNLGSIRSALAIYYGDTEGFYPVDNLASLMLNKKYLSNIPQALAPKTTNNAGHTGNNTVTATVAGYVAQDGGGWYFDNSGLTSTTNTWGQILVACSHNDLRNVRWTSY